MVSITSDSGLCGGIHSSVSKATKLAIKENPDIKLAVVGERAKAQISRAVPNSMELSFSAIGKDIPSFAAASQVADEILSSGIEFDEVSLARSFGPEVGRGRAESEGVLSLEGKEGRS